MPYDYIIVDEKQTENLEIIRQKLQTIITDSGVPKYNPTESMHNLYKEWQGTKHLKAEIIGAGNPTNSTTHKPTMVYNLKGECIIEDMDSISAIEFQNNYKLIRAELSYNCAYYKKNGSKMDWGLCIPKLLNIQVERINHDRRGFVF